MIWTLNPFVAVISTRGNAESVLSVLVIGTLYLIERKQLVLAAITFGISVHFKVYPIIYAIPIWFGIDHCFGSSFQYRLFSWRRASFGFIAASTFFMLNWIMYGIYGQTFIDETYLYHIYRKDHRHNFSLYFYHMYLGTESSFTWSLLSFVPQITAVAWLGVRFANDFVFSWFLQTFAFVALNKVCTSQVNWNNVVFYVVSLFSATHCSANEIGE
jgi:GPI mannosyltransferase 1 subunit M